jgi:hypothetical protein
MGKRVDKNDATQEVSASMLVPPAKPPVYPKVPTGNDASMWMSAPVSADDFVSGPNKKPTAPRSGRGVMVAVFALLFVGTAGAGVWYAFLRERPKETTPAYAAGRGSAAPSQTAATAPADAAVAVAAPDAAIAATADAGVAADPAALVADAVSGADPAVKKSTKKRAVTKKKTTAKKKTATAPKKKRR